MASFKDIHNFGCIQKKSIQENLTPHKIAVILLMREFCAIKWKGKPISLEVDEISCLDPQNRRDFCVLMLKLIQCPDVDLCDLLELLHNQKYQLLDIHLKNFGAKLQEMYKNGVDCLLDLMKQLKQLMEPLVSISSPIISKTSVMGMYLRRILLLFEKWSFSQVVSMYHAYKIYYEKCFSKEACVKQKSETLKADNEMEVIVSRFGVMLHGSTDLSGIPKKKTTGSDDQAHWSQRQAEFFIAQQATLLQTNEMAALPPPQLQEKIRHLLHANPECAEAHYLSYLNCLRVKEFVGSLNSLYHGFDRSAVIVDNKANTQEERNKTFRYAALNMAILYAQFGYRKEALSALKEAMMLAQEGNDAVCLQHVLSWLYKLSDENKEVLMERSISKSNNLSLCYLTSLGIQSFSQFAGATGGRPALVFDLLLKSDVLNCQHSMIDLLTNSYIQKAALWCFYGRTEMASISSQLLLHLNTTNPMQGVLSYNGEGICQAMCNVANILTEEGEYHIASLILSEVERYFPNEPAAKAWIFSKQILNFTKAMHHGKWHQAEVAVAQLAAIDKWESQLRRAELYLNKGSYSNSSNCINSVLEYCRRHLEDEFINPSFRVRALILASELHCCSVVSTGVPAGAVPLLTSALAVAQLYFLDYLAALVVLQLANVQLQLGLPTQALKLVNKSLPAVLSHGSAFDQGRALLLYAKCKVASSVGQTEEMQKCLILQAIQILSQAKINFVKVEAQSRVQDVLYLQALLYNEVGLISEKRKCALEFRQCTQQYPTKTTTTLMTRL